jgi:hypothetical protein
MAEQEAAVAAASVKQEQILKLRPTLYIGVGGTGMEVILRIRRRILGATWGDAAHPARVDNLAGGFPVAEFIHFDLDQGALVESGKSRLTDPLAERVKLGDEDKIVENFEIERYSRSDDDLAKYPHIEEWSPLTPKKIRELGIDPAKGAGQIRAISRLYFFDKYQKIKEKIRVKLGRLRSGLSNDARLKSLGFDLDQSKFRIVVIGSIAGGSGGGAFLDMGWLAQWIARDTVNAADVEMMLFLPTGYQGANKERTEANAYAALMELETCMRGDARYVSRWDAYDRPQLGLAPYDEVYLIDTGNLAQLHTGNVRDVYDMTADALFEDFASIDFANRKRSVAINQRQHKISLFSPPVPGVRFGDMKLSYSQSYSAFGQSVLDTQRGLRRDLRVYRWTEAMLQAFFGVAAEMGGNRATDRQRDDFMAAYMHLSPRPFTEFPDFSARQIAIDRGEFLDYQLTDTLLNDRQGALVEGIQQKVSDRLEGIAAGFERGEWSGRIRDALKELEHDAVRDQDSAADTTEDRIARQAGELRRDIMGRLREQLYTYLDNRDYGGLEFVLSLVEQVKDRLENPNTGLIGALAANAVRYGEIRDALRTHEYERLLGHLEQTRGFSLFGNKDEQARLILGQLKLEIGNYLKFHLRAKAARQASELLRQLSRELGERQGLDERGESRWSGLVGELQAGRNAVLAMIAALERKIELLRDDARKEHATYILIDAPDEQTPLPPPKDLRDWADEVFKDIGGSRQLFPMLADAAERERLLGLLRNKAERQMARLSATPAGEGDPLLSALLEMNGPERQRRFAELLARAMPWIDAGWGKDFSPRPDQFKCYIGVSRAGDYERHFKQEILAQLPASAGITPQQVAFVDTGIAGRAVCYCELSGVPLTALRGMESWRTSYRKEFEKIPLHTHRDSTRFTHPLAPSTAELNALADDFGQYLLGVMLGVLKRDPNPRITPPGQYKFAVSPGDERRMGNERAFRLGGLPETGAPTYRQQILDAIAAKMADLDTTRLATLAALADHYEKRVYTPPLAQDERGAEIPVKGFACAMAGEIARELREKARRKGAREEDIADRERRASERLELWTAPIENSEADAYAWEVRAAEDAPRIKRAAAAEFFQPGWLEQRLSEAAPQTAPAAPIPSGPPPAPSAPPLASPPPPPAPGFQYYLAIAGQQYGPYSLAQMQQWATARQLDPATMGWREGMAQWLPLHQIAELSALFAAAPAPPPPPGGTPLGPPPLP